jgi:hypothetical protein
LKSWEGAGGQQRHACQNHPYPVVRHKNSIGNASEPQRRDFRVHRRFRISIEESEVAGRDQRRPSTLCACRVPALTSLCTCDSPLNHWRAVRVQVPDLTPSGSRPCCSALSANLLPERRPCCGEADVHPVVSVRPGFDPLWSFILLGGSGIIVEDIADNLAGLVGLYHLGAGKRHQRDEGFPKRPASSTFPGCRIKRNS